MGDVFLLDPADPDQTDIFLQAMTDIHIDCITNDYTLVTFLPPLSKAKINQYYAAKVNEIATGKYTFVTEWIPVDPKSPPPEGITTWQNRELAGFVLLNRSPSETGPFRAHVEKLLVSPRHRRKAVARRIMARLEDEARKTDSWMLTLDTEVGSGADLMYPKLGYIPIGVIPQYGISPRDNKTLSDGLFFYKDLRSS